MYEMEIQHKYTLFYVSLPEWKCTFNFKIFLSWYQTINIKNDAQTDHLPTKKSFAKFNSIYRGLHLWNKASVPNNHLSEVQNHRTVWKTLAKSVFAHTIYLNSSAKKISFAIYTEIHYILLKSIVLIYE